LYDENIIIQVELFVVRGVIRRGGLSATTGRGDSRGIKFLEEEADSGSTLLHRLLLVLSQPIPRLFRRGSQLLASGARSANGGEETITEEEARITSTVLSSIVVASGHSQEHTRDSVERRNGDKGTAKEGHHIGQHMTHEGAVLLLRSGVELGQGAQGKAGQEPACSTAEAVNRVARFTTAGLALPALPAVVLTLRIPASISPKTTLTILIHDGLFVLTVEHTINPATEDASEHAEETQDGGDQEDDGFEESVLDHIAFLQHLSVATDGATGAADDLSHQAEVRHLTSDGVAPALSVLLLATACLEE